MGLTVSVDSQRTFSRRSVLLLSRGVTIELALKVLKSIFEIQVSINTSELIIRFAKGEIMIYKQ